MSERGISVTYTNWRGETRKRLIEPETDGLRWDATEWHPEQGWLLRARDVEKAAMRDFALANCNFAAGEKVTEIEALKAENERLRRERNAARADGIREAARVTADAAGGIELESARRWVIGGRKRLLITKALRHLSVALHARAALSALSAQEDDPA